MPYSYENSKGQKYYLHGKTVTLQGGREQKIHFFAREPKAGEALDRLPAGHVVVENERTGLPFLKRDAGTKSAPSAKARAGVKTKAAPKATATATRSRAKK
jgi:hypothetical protein